MATDSIPSRLLAQAKKRPHEPAYFEKSSGLWRATSWSEYADQVRRAGKAMMAAGVEPGGSVAILGFNRAEWVIFDVAAMSIGGAAAGIYTTCSPVEVEYIVSHCEAPIVLVEDQNQWEKIKERREQLPKLKHVVLMRNAPTIDDPLVLSWDAFMSRGDEVTDEDYLARVEALEPDGLATLIYTSGTTGPPKGVMLSHKNLAWTSDVATEITGLSSSDSNLSYLPLSHIAEQMFSIHGHITNGNSLYFAESIDAVPENLKEIQPTVVFGVPRIWEKFHAGVTAKLSEAEGAKAALLRWARGVASRVNALRNEGGSPDAILALQYRLASKLVFGKLKQALGLGRARMCVSGAAPIGKEVLEFFGSLDIIIHEVYGQSEDTGPTSFNQPGRNRYGSVGPRVPGVEVKIADDGEIVVRGPNVFLGYFKEPAATAEALIDGWLHSGDLGEFDADGFLHITGRKKDIIITAGGKNVAPKNIEASLKSEDLVAESVVIGDKRKYLVALLMLDEEAAKREGFTQPYHEDSSLRARLQKHVDAINEHLARVEQIKKFAVLSRPFSVETGELTPTLKVKRNKVNEHFASEIEALYAEEGERAQA